MNRTPIILLLSVFLALQGTVASSFDVLTHRALSNRAVQPPNSSLDNFLKTELNFPGGIQNTLFNMVNRSINDWIQEGSEREDDDFRFCNHFHNPLLSWGQAGLSVPCSVSGNQSSVLWGQSTSNQFSWQNARQSYFTGLTASTQSAREQNLALAFETIGHLIHLVQDAAVPAHTRDDAHPPWNTDGFETFVKNIRLMPLFDQLTSTSKRFDPSILTLAPNMDAPIPIAHIIDTQQPGAIPSAGTNIGMAQYSNGNFVSDDTIFTPGFAFPRVQSLGPPFVEPSNGVTYRSKDLTVDPQAGEPVTYFVAQDAAGNYFLSQGGTPDPFIFEDYGALLLPRAIGYSAGLIDYFFRGRLEIVQASRPGEMPTKIRVKVRNVTPNEQSGTGDIVGVVKFMQGGVPSFAVSPTQALFNLTDVFQEVVFDFSGTPFPNAPDLFLTVVYKGPLSFIGSQAMENNAVIAGGKFLVVLNPQNPTLTCPNGSVNFTAGGGTSPYTWTTTKGVITPSGVSNENAVLTPPATNPAVQGRAFAYLGQEQTSMGCTGCASGSIFHGANMYDCGGNYIVGDSQMGSGCTPIPGLNCGNLVGPLLCITGTTPACGLPICNHEEQTLPPFPIHKYMIATGAGLLCDARTQAMIDAGCKPCTVEMRGTTVTVTDSATPQASVSETVRVQ